MTLIPVDPAVLHESPTAYGNGGGYATLRPGEKTFKPAAELRALLTSNGITPHREVNTYRGGRRRGSLGTLVFKLLGYGNARSYVAGFSQWSRQRDTPVES